MNKHKAALLLASAICGAGGATPAFAADDTNNEIVVTARRVEERLQDVPISIAVYNQEQLTSRNIFNAADVALYTPSVSTNSRYGQERATFTIRGFTQEGGTAPSVGVYFADVIGLRAAGQTTSGNGMGVGNLFDLENIQVLKGPQGTLFGRNTTGGAVLIVPKRPTDAFEGYLEGSVGNYGMMRAQGVINVPLGDGLKIRAGIDSNHRDGYQKNYSGVGPSAFSNTNYTAARLSILAELTPDIENYTVGTYSHSDTAGPLLRIIACNRAANTATAVLGCRQLDRQIARGNDLHDGENNRPDAGVKIEQWQIINTTTWTASDALTVKNIISYGVIREQTTMNLIGDNLILSTPTAPYTPTDGLNYGNVFVAPGIAGYNVNQSTFTEEFQLQGQQFENKLNWQAGVYLEVSNPRSDNGQFNPVNAACTDYRNFRCTPLPSVVGPTGATIAAAATTTLSLPMVRTYFRNLGLYAQAIYSLTDQLKLTAGFRWTRDRVINQSYTVTASMPRGGTPTLSCTKFPTITLASLAERDKCFVRFVQRSAKPTWMIGLDYKPTEDLMVYAKWSRGYRAGGVNALTTGKETWDPEDVDTYEVGAKANFDGAVRGFLNVAGFYNDFRNQQLQSNATQIVTRTPLTTRNSPVILNAGKSRIWGIEVDGSLELFEGFRLDGSYAYVDTKVLQFNPPPLDPNFFLSTPAPTTTTRQGDPLTYTPKNKYTITGTYTLPLDESLGKISFGATFSHADSQLANRSSPIIADQFLKPTNILNLNFNWNNFLGQPLDLAVFMTNVTDSKYQLTISPGYANSGYDTSLYGEPRIWGVRARYRFGE